MTKEKDILGIPLNSTRKQIRKAYFSKIKSSHPDRGGQDFVKVHDAYTTLMGNLSLLNSYDVLTLKELKRDGESYYYICSCSQVIVVEIDVEDVLYECYSCSFSFQLKREKSPL